MFRWMMLKIPSKSKIFEAVSFVWVSVCQWQRKTSGVFLYCFLSCPLRQGLSLSWWLLFLCEAGQPASPSSCMHKCPCPREPPPQPSSCFSFAYRMNTSSIVVTETPKAEIPSSVCFCSKSVNRASNLAGKKVLFLKDERQIIYHPELSIAEKTWGLLSRHLFRSQLYHLVS